jgi:hypothetical protein
MAVREWLWIQQPDSCHNGFSNSCQEEKNAWMYSVIMSRNNDTSVEYISQRNDLSFDSYDTGSLTLYTSFVTRNWGSL